jgi:hypothetical protein
MNLDHILVNEAINALSMVLPSYTVELLQAAIDREVREGDRPVADQLMLLEVNGMLRLMNQRRRVFDEERHREGLAALWEEVPEQIETDPLKLSRLAVRVTHPRCSECQMAAPMHKLDCSRPR